jgi:outer membrane protein assembly factor BamB
MRFRFMILALALLHGTAQLCAQPAPGTPLWTYTAPAAIATSPALAPDGTIYVGTSTALCAITNAGSNKWTFAANVRGSPAIGSDGTVYFGDYSSGIFYARNSDGSQKWSFPSPGGIWSSPALGLDGTVYFVAGGRLVALASVGTNKWQYPYDDSSTVAAISPIIGADGTVYIGSIFGEALYAINPDGTKKWNSALGNSAGDSAAIGADGTIFVTGGGLYAFTPEGTNLWSTSIDTFIGSSPVVAKDGTIYVGERINLNLWSIKPNGQTNWSRAGAQVFHPPPPTAAAIDSSGTIYYCNSNTVFALSPAGEILWTFFPYGQGASSPPALSSPTIGPDGTIYAAFGSTLYAIAGTNALADSPWPMYHQNPRHTGKVEKPSLNKPQKRSDGGFQFELYGQLSNSYTVQTSTSLLSWSSLTSVLVTNVPMDIVDAEATNFPSRFYGALSP